MTAAEVRVFKTSSRRRTLGRLLGAVGAIFAILYGATLLAAYTPLTERTIRTEVVVDAPVAAVWQVLADLDSYTAWNPFLQRASGTVAVGETLRLEAYLNASTMIFTPTVLEVKKNHELRWLGRVGLPGVFDGEHNFTLTSLSKSRVRVEQNESFHGVLVPFFGKLLDETEKRFIDLNKALKARAETPENPW